MAISGIYAASLVDSLTLCQKTLNSVQTFSVIFLTVDTSVYIISVLMLWLKSYNTEVSGKLFVKEDRCIWGGGAFCCFVCLLTCFSSSFSWFKNLPCLFSLCLYFSLNTVRILIPVTLKSMFTNGDISPLVQFQCTSVYCYEW